MYLLEFIQGDRTHKVGLFETEVDVIEWINVLPFVEKEVEAANEKTFTTYTLKYESVPLYNEISWRDSLYPITHYMFTPDDDILICWNKIPLMNAAKGLVEGGTQVDSCIIPNDETARYIQAREEIRETIIKYYEKLGQRVETGGVGSEDGEYLKVDNGPFVHLDYYLVDQWENKTSAEAFLQQLET